MRLLLILITTSMFMSPVVALANDEKKEQEVKPVDEPVKEENIITTEYGVLRLTFHPNPPPLIPAIPPPTLLWSPLLENNDDSNYFRPFVLIQKEKIKKTL